MNAPTTITTPPAIGQPYEGGIYAGLTVHENAVYHLILLPGDTSATLAKAGEWAKEQDGELPSRVDQLVLWENLRSKFTANWYWSSEPYAGNDAYAWCQDFGDGNQDGTHEGYELRARAVRRVPISPFADSPIHGARTMTAAAAPEAHTTIALQSAAAPAGFLPLPRIGQPFPDQGGVYAGDVRGDDGQPDYHLILADWAEDTKTRNWKSAKAWASALIGSDKHADYGLPTLREQAILFGNLKDLFKTDGYWSSEILAGDDASAWCQLFHNGDQDDDPEDNELRARAVRRVPIE